MARTVLGARRRTKDDPTLAEAVRKHLDLVATEGNAELLRKSTAAEEAVELEPRFRFSTGSELEAAAVNLARRLKRGDTPSEDDLNASLVMIMDAEEQRRIIFEQKSGIRTPDPATGISSFDEEDPLGRLARTTGVGAPESEAPSFLGNIRALFDLP